jgi:thiol:disulfide interchange protein
MLEIIFKYICTFNRRITQLFAPKPPFSARFKVIIAYFAMRFHVIALLFLFTSPVYSQMVQPVHWTFEAAPVSGDEYDLIATAQLDKGWNIYSQFLPSDDGPIKTEFTFKPAPQYALIGTGREVSDHKKSGYDKMFDMNITKFSQQVAFVRRIKVKDPTAKIVGSVRFGTCDEEKCLPPQEEDFTFKLPSNHKITPASIPQTASQPAAQPAPAPTYTPPAPAAQPAPPKVKLGGLIAQATPNKVVTPPKPAPATLPPTTLSNPIPNALPTASNQKEGLNPVSWQFTSKKVSETEYDLVFNATIAKGWHIYSQFIKDGGPNPTLIEVKNAAKSGKASEASSHKSDHFDKQFEMQLVDFEQDATFTQRVQVKDLNTPVQATIEVQACDAGKCLPPDPVEVVFDLKTGIGTVAGAAASEVNPNATSTPPNVQKEHPVNKFKFDKTNENVTCDATGANVNSEKGTLWWIFLMGFLGGLFAILTPCVFPMIPLTVGLFTKGQRTRSQGLWDAAIYALSIIVIYVGLGLIVTSLFGADALNLLSTNVWFNIGFGILFIVFAISFFGYFEITLPSWLLNKSDEASNRGGLIGIFFMAFTLALVSFSCTGPIIGTLLVETATGGNLSGPIAGMTGFATALALPFGLFAAFPAWLKSLPKSGGWMDDVKAVLGFIEIALAFKFFSVADLTMNKKFIPYELMLGIWVLCAVGLGLYFAKILRFKPEYVVNSQKKAAQPNKFAWVRPSMIGLSILTFFYLVMGFRYDIQSGTFKTPPLASGILPPAGHSYIYPKSCPLNLDCYHDFDAGLAVAKAQNKPILLDFTGYGCVNCRKMEDLVWGKTGVYELIKDKYVLISLYTDDRKPLSNNEVYSSTFDNKIKKTVGNKWADFEAVHFGRNSQPYYVLLDPNTLKVLNQPVGFTPDPKTYQSFLQCGLGKFKSN